MVAPHFSLPGYWISDHPRPTAFALHSSRPWLAVARRNPDGSDFIERVDTDTGDTVRLAASKRLQAEKLAWVGDHLATIGARGDVPVRVYDGSGQGLLAEHPLRNGGFTTVVPHPHGADIVSTATIAERTDFETLSLRDFGADITIDYDASLTVPHANAFRFARPYGVDSLGAPLWHPDGHRVALFERVEAGVNVLLATPPSVRAFALPRETAQGQLSFLGWAAPERLLIGVVRGEGERDDGAQRTASLWCLDVDTGTVHRLFARGGAVLGARNVALSPSGADLALTIERNDGTHALSLLKLATGTLLPLSHPDGQGAPVSAYWVDDDTLFLVYVLRGQDACLVRVQSRTQRRTELYALRDEGVDCLAHVVARGGGRVLMQRVRPSLRVFVTDARLGSVREGA